MNTDLKPHIIQSLATRNLSARLDVAATAKLLGFAKLDIQILMGTGKLTPLGNPAPNAPKWFAAIDMIALSVDVNWLHKATKDLGKYWKHKRERAGRKAGERCAALVDANKNGVDDRLETPVKEEEKA